MNKNSFEAVHEFLEQIGLLLLCLRCRSGLLLQKQTSHKGLIQMHRVYYDSRVMQMKGL